ncbi:MAG TPA: G8 domain-containing protein [Actinomycetota bacterium]|nr:G8 domain-containing protein [Actinomycetota bacterium]
MADDDGRTPEQKRLSRRRFLVVGGAVGAVGVAGAAAALASRDGGGTAAPTTVDHSQHQPAASSTATTGRPATVAGAKPWSDPDTWPKGVPGRGDVAVVTRRIVLDTDARVAGVTVEPGGELIFQPSASRTLHSTGNVVVKGRLVMRPASHEVDHLLVFEGVDEGRMVGGGMDVVKADVGLWVMGAGTLDLAGTGRRAWTRLAGAIAAGTTSLTLKDAPKGWRPGDELLVAPTLAPDQADNWTAYSAANVRSVRGRVVTLDQPTSFAHPAVDVVTDAGAGRVQTAEVLNLTRNVRIEGTPGHRSHVFIRSSSPQKLKGVAIRHVGPRKKAEEFTELVLGRYGLHLHMCDDGSRGSEVEGVVIRDAGNHTFVPHLSNGIAFRDCISHNTFEDAFWWDGAPDTRTPGSPSHDILYERCVASLVQYDPPFRGFTLTGFSLGRGNGNVIRDSVAVGIQGDTNAAGFQWPEGGEGIWKFERNIAHNNANHGIFTWQNTGKLHVITSFTAYHNAGAGISHGAYNNRYTYRDSTLFGNRGGALIVHADSWGGPDTPLQFLNLACHGASQSEYLVTAPRHHGANEFPPPRFVASAFTGATKAAFAWLYDGNDGPSTNEIVDIVNCTFKGNPFLLGPKIGADSRIRVQDKVHGSIILRRADRPSGRPVKQWNARVEQNPGFRLGQR